MAVFANAVVEPSRCRYRVDVNGDVGHEGQVVQKLMAHLDRDFVAASNRQVRIHGDVQLSVESVPIQRARVSATSTTSDV